MRRRQLIAASSALALPRLAAAQAGEANRRLHRRYVHLKERGKPANVINTAIAREISGFVWALANCEG